MTQPVGSNAQPSPLSTEAPGSGQAQAPAFLQLVQAETGKQKVASGFSMATRPKSPQNAPSKIDLTTLQPKFDELWAKSDAPLAADDREHGGTLVTDRQGNLKLINVGEGEKGQFKPNLQAGPGETVQGVFHTHPKETPGQGAISFSAGDTAYLFEKNMNVMIVQSGDRQFMYLRTVETPANIDHQAVYQEQLRSRGRLMFGQGLDDATTSQRGSLQAAETYKLAYYEGQNGVFTRVSP